MIFKTILINIPIKACSIGTHKKTLSSQARRAPNTGIPRERVSATSGGPTPFYAYFTTLEELSPYQPAGGIIQI